MKKITLIGLVFILLTSACNKIIFRDIDCRDFSNQENLKYFGGIIGDTVTFKKPDDNLAKFVIKEKYLVHRTGYTSDTGCGCHDTWGLLMTSGTDTISLFNGVTYVEDNDANKYNKLFVKIDEKLSVFITEDISTVDLSIDTIDFANVIKYNYEFPDNLNFNTVYMAKNYGIIQMKRQNGEIWTNVNLTDELNTNINTFDYSENTCE